MTIISIFSSMKNVTKFYRPSNATFTLRISLSALFISILLTLPFPADWLIRPILNKKAPQIAKLLQWESSSVQILGGITLRQPKLTVNDSHQNFELQMPEIKISIAYQPLLQQQIEISDIWVDKININSPQSSKTLQIGRIIAAPIALLQSIKSLSAQSVSLQIRNLSISSGENNILAIANIMADCNDCKEATSEYKITAKKAQLPSFPEISNLEANLSMSKNGIKLHSAIADICQGNVNVTAKIPIAQQKSTSFSLFFNNIQTQNIAEKLLPPKAVIKTSLSGSIQGKLVLNSLPTLSGRGKIKFAPLSIANLPVQQSPFFKSFAPGFDQIHFESIQMDSLRITEGKIYFENIEASSKRMTLTGKGNSDINGNHYFLLNAILPSNELKKLPALTKTSLADGASGSGSAQFEIKGSLTSQSFSPTGSTIKKAAGNHIRNLGKSIRSLFK